jgi:hypothetical protein
MPPGYRRSDNAGWAVHSPGRCLFVPYFAYSTARVSRMTVTLIWPG